MNVLRVRPWWTDGCNHFLDNFLLWYPNFRKKRLFALEFGGGNSTLYLLQNNVKVICVESDDIYLQFVAKTAEETGCKVATITYEELNDKIVETHDLIIMKATTLDDVDGLIDRYKYDIISNDGISRRAITRKLIDNEYDSVIIFDNAEYCANFGRLHRSSGKTELLRIYREFLRSPKFSKIIFEHQGRMAEHRTGWEAPPRWASAIIWPKSSPLEELMLTTEGLPLVNELGLEDEDLKSLDERCPFDWEKNEWMVKECPQSLDLGLKGLFKEDL